jgi:hypothetical protein
MKAKGESHENQDQCKGWIHRSLTNVTQSKTVRSLSTKTRKEKAMKTKTNVKAGVIIHN